MPADLARFLEKRRPASCGRWETSGCKSGLVSPVSPLAAADAHLEAEARVRELDEEPRLLEKDVSASSSLLA